VACFGPDFACGSMALCHVVSIFALPSAKMETKKRGKYRFAAGEKR